MTKDQDGSTGTPRAGQSLTAFVLDLVRPYRKWVPVVFAARLADYARAIVGSINLAPGSFDDRRELAIETDDEHVIKRLCKVAEHDWEHSHALDLSDEGLMADLAKRAGTKEGAAKPVLDVDDEDDGGARRKHHGHH